MSQATIQAPEVGSTAVAIRAIAGEGAPVYLPLSALRLDERNVRKDKPTDDEIAQLADLIDAQGLLQNLTAVLYAQPVRGTGKAKKNLYTHGVIAGGRRLRALQLLVKRGHLSADEEILCSVVSEDRALAVSTAENSGRAPMSTADTIVAFADMVKAGAGVEDLAVCFGLSPLTVQRRLRLANASPKLFALFRDEAMTLDQLMALSLTDDQDKQEAAWNSAREYNRSPSRLRALIAGEGLSAHIVRFVTLAAYEAAGGNVLRDLFAEADESPAYVVEPDLMMRLATDKLEGIAEELRAAGGLAWVDTFLSLTHSEREQYMSAPTTSRPAMQGEAAAIAALQAEVDKMNADLEARYDSDEGEDDPKAAAELETLEKTCAAKESELADLEGRLIVIRPEVSQLVGALVSIDHNGQAAITRGQIRKADSATVKRAVAKAANDDAPEGTELAQPDPKAGVSDRLCHQLTAHRTRALQASLLDNQRVALAALAHPLLTTVFYNCAATWTSPSALRVKADDCEAQLKTWAPDLVESRAEKVVQVARAELEAMLPEETSALLPWLLDQPTPALIQILTVAAALSLNAINGTGKSPATEPLALALGLNMADWWTPTVDSYLGSVSKAVIAQAVTEAGMPDDAKALAALKKAEAATKAQELLTGKAWLPAVLR